MLADHVEAPFLGLDNVIAESFICWCRIESVRPPALVERTEMEKLLAVKGHSLAIAFILAYRDFTHCRISFNRVNDLAFTGNAYFDAIEIWAVRRPCFHLRHLHDGISVHYISRCNHLSSRMFRTVSDTSFYKLHLHGITGLHSRSGNLETDGSFRKV